MKPVRVIQYGLGPIGRWTALALLEKKDVEIVGAVDISPEMVGKDLGEILGIPQKLGVCVTNDAPALFRKVKAQAVTHTTGSFFKDVYDQLEQAVTAGISVVSSTEELLFPQLRNPSLAAKLDRAARKGGASILGTGVNPGFVMDLLALVLSGVSRKIRSVRITRHVDAATRRQSLQRKVGAGMMSGEFRKLVKEGKLGHIGLMESMYLVARGLGWELSESREKIEPVTAEKLHVTEYFTVEPGRVAGLKHTACGLCDGRKVIDMELCMYIGAPDPMDTIEIDGDPKLSLRISGGVAGDVATVAMMVNAVPRVIEAPPGLRSLLDLPIPRAFRAV